MQLQNHLIVSVFDKPQEIFVVFAYKIKIVISDFAILAHKIIKPFFKVDFRN